MSTVALAERPLANQYMIGVPSMPVVLPQANAVVVVPKVRPAVEELSGARAAVQGVRKVFDELTYGRPSYTMTNWQMVGSFFDKEHAPQWFCGGAVVSVMAGFIASVARGEVFLGAAFAGVGLAAVAVAATGVAKLIGQYQARRPLSERAVAKLTDAAATCPPDDRRAADKAVHDCIRPLLEVGTVSSEARELLRRVRTSYATAPRLEGRAALIEKLTDLLESKETLDAEALAEVRKTIGELPHDERAALFAYCREAFLDYVRPMTHSTRALVIELCEGTPRPAQPAPDMR